MKENELWRDCWGPHRHIQAHPQHRIVSMGWIKTTKIDCLAYIKTAFKAVHCYFMDLFCSIDLMKLIKTSVEVLYDAELKMLFSHKD